MWRSSRPGGGRIVDLTTLVTDNRAQGWRVTSRDGRYAQVALPRRSFSESFDSTTLDRPFRVSGRFSDSELIELVAYIRSNPKMPLASDDPNRRSYPDQLEGHHPLVQLTRLDRSSVEIWLADSPHSGQHAKLRYQAGAWHLDEIGLYIV